MNKGIAKIEVFEQNFHSYVRKYVPRKTKEEYYLNEYLDERPENEMPTLFAAFADADPDEKTLQRIEAIIDDWKKRKGIK